MTHNTIDQSANQSTAAVPVPDAGNRADRPLGTPLGSRATRVLFLGAGELGKEVVIELMRLGAWVCAADSYAGAPAQQVAHEAHVLDMANAAQLRALFDEVRPDIIVPEVEAIATGELAEAAAAGMQVVPSAEIAAICMDRERLRVIAHEELGLPYHAVPFCRHIGGAACRRRGRRVSVRGQAGDELVRTRPSRWCVPPMASTRRGWKR